MSTVPAGCEDSEGLDRNTWNRKLQISGCLPKENGLFMCFARLHLQRQAANLSSGCAMSDRLVNKAFEAPGVRGMEKFVLVALARFASDETDTCNPSEKEIAEAVGITQPGVHKILRKLVDYGLIVKENGKGRGKSSYLLKLGDITPVITSEVDITPVITKNDVVITPVIATDVAITPVISTDVAITPVITRNVPQEETAPSLEERSPTPPKEDNPTTKEEKETPQTPRESHIHSGQLDLWGNPVGADENSSCVGCSDDILGMFNEFWDQYPLKENRDSALRYFEKLIGPKSDQRSFMDTILGSIEIERKSTRWKKGEFMSPAEWLKKGEWCLSRFAEFWSKYPRKVAKADALKAFKKLIGNKQDIDWFMSIVMASLDRWSKNAQWTKDGGKFIPYPATWLNRGSWEDSKNGETKEINSGRPEFLQYDNDFEEDLIRRMEGR